MAIDDGLRPLFRKHLPMFFWTSIETGGTSLGIPDSNYLSKDGVEGWVEFKWTDGWAVTLRDMQIGWLTRRARYNGRAWIAVRRHRRTPGPRTPAFDELYMVPGGLAAAAAAGGLRGLAGDALCLGAGGPAGWDWRRAEALLLSD